MQDFPTKEQLKKLQEALAKEGIDIDPNKILDIHERLAKTTPQQILDKIAEFRNIDLRTITDKELSDAILKAISIDIDGNQQSMLYPRFGTFPPETRFYRIRKLKANDNTFPNQTITKEQDVWNPPVECITRPGRLNKIHESLLYTSPISPLAAIEEMDIQNGDRLGLIVYKARVPIEAVQIGFWENIPELSEEENLKMRIYTDFLRTEFTRDVGIGTEYLYKVSEDITKTYFDLPPEEQDAWCYPSVKSKKHVNVCFRPDKAKEKLEFLGVVICQVEKGDNFVDLECDHIALDIDENKNLIYKTLASDNPRKTAPITHKNGYPQNR